MLKNFEFTYPNKYKIREALNLCLLLVAPCVPSATGPLIPFKE